MAGHWVKLLDSLNQVFQKSPRTRIFVTGRPHIRPEIRRCLEGKVANVSICPKRDDIIRFLHSRLHKDTTRDAMDSTSSLEADILKKIPEDVSEMYVKQRHKESYLKLSTNAYIFRFLLRVVSLNIGAILRETTIYRRGQKLSAMTDGLGLGEAYGATLYRVKGQGGDKTRLSMAALMWISHSERPLKASELCDALAVETGSPDLSPGNVPSIRTLLACCQGLITVDKEASTVRLIHYTLQEYLRYHPKLFGRAQPTMAETCLNYLNSRKIKALSTSPLPISKTLPFLNIPLYAGECMQKGIFQIAQNCWH